MINKIASVIKILCLLYITVGTFLLIEFVSTPYLVSKTIGYLDSPSYAFGLCIGIVYALIGMRMIKWLNNAVEQIGKLE